MADKYGIRKFIAVGSSSLMHTCCAKKENTGLDFGFISSSLTGMTRATISIRYSSYAPTQLCSGDTFGCLSISLMTYSG